MPNKKEQQTPSTNSPANIIILIGKNNEGYQENLENRIEQFKEAFRKASKGKEVEFGEIPILGDGKKTIQEVVEEKKALLQSTEFTRDNTAMFLIAHGTKNQDRFGVVIDNDQSLQEFLKTYPHLTKFPIKTQFCNDGSMFKTATQKELKELETLEWMKGVDASDIGEEFKDGLSQTLETQTKELTDKIKINRDNSIIEGATISTSTSSKFSELRSDIVENIEQYIENIYSNPKSPLQQLIAEDLASPSSRYILHNNKITKLSRFLKGLNVESDEVKNHSLKELAKEFIDHRKEQLKQAYPDQKGFIETLGATKKELNSLVDKILNKALHLFAGRGTTSAVKILLSKEEEIDINHMDRWGWTALHTALHTSSQFALQNNSHQEIVKMLLEKGANPNSLNQYGFTALHLACQNGHQEIVKMLLERDGVNSQNLNKEKILALHLACENGHKGIVEMLLMMRVNPSIKSEVGRTALHFACQNGHKEIVGILLEKGVDPAIQDSWERTALHIACQNGRHEVVGMLLGRVSPDIPDQDGFTALHLACQNGHHEVVGMLLDGGVNPAIQDGRRRTALHLACQNGRHEVVGILLEKGVDPAIQDKEGYTALHLACENGNQKIMKMLLGRASPDIQDYADQTALHLACKNGHKEIVEMLVGKGATINLIDTEGQTALELARENDHQEIADYLVSKGARTGFDLSQKRASKSSESEGDTKPPSHLKPKGIQTTLISKEETKNR